MTGSFKNKKGFGGKLHLLFMRFQWFLFVISRKHTRSDFKVAMLFLNKNESSVIVFSKIDRALNLISEFDPRRYQQIQRDVKRIWIFIAKPNYAEWWSELQMCVLDGEYFCRADVSPAEIAATIVHEATHARLDHMGIKYKEDSRAQIERICFKSEIAFAKRLPNDEKLIKRAESYLTIPEAHWTNAEFQQRNLDALAELGRKSWAARLLHPIVKWLVKMKRARNR